MTQKRAASKPRVDLLEEDEPLPGQQYACLSFLSPEGVVARREAFEFERFIAERCAALREALDELRQVMGEQYADKVTAFEERHAEWLDETKTQEAFDAFVEENRLQLADEFSRKHDLQTSVRGLKIRGVYGDLEEAKQRCLDLRSKDPHFDVYVASVGKWLPWNPSVREVADVDFQEDQLNQLMAKYKEQRAAETKAYSEMTAARVAEAMRQDGIGGASSSKAAAAADDDGASASAAGEVEMKDAA